MKKINRSSTDTYLEHVKAKHTLKDEMVKQK